MAESVPPPEPGLPGERVGPRTLEILTRNLQWFPGNQQASDATAEERHLEAVAGELRRAAPDILCLQKVREEAGTDRLLVRLPGYRMQVVSDFRGAQEVAILSRIDATTAYAEEFRAAAEKPPRGFANAAFEVGTGPTILEAGYR